MKNDKIIASLTYHSRCGDDDSLFYCEGEEEKIRNDFREGLDVRGILGVSYEVYPEYPGYENLVQQLHNIYADEFGYDNEEEDYTPYKKHTKDDKLFDIGVKTAENEYTIIDDNLFGYHQAINEMKSLIAQGKEVRAIYYGDSNTEFSYKELIDFKFPGEVAG